MLTSKSFVCWSGKPAKLKAGKLCLELSVWSGDSVWHSFPGPIYSYIGKRPSLPACWKKW